MSAIFSPIPNWVTVLFFALIYYGYAQSKTRKVTRFRITVLPAIMVCLSLDGVLHEPQASGLALAAWLAGSVAALLINRTVQHARGVVLDPDGVRYVLPGSLIPLALMMSVFAEKFTLGFLAGNQLLDKNGLATILICSCVSGLISGTFVARAWQIIRAGNSGLCSANVQEA